MERQGIFLIQAKQSENNHYIGFFNNIGSIGGTSPFLKNVNCVKNKTSNT